MNFTELLNREIEAAYKAAFGLLDLVDDDLLDWRPSTGSNWMTTGQLLHHLPEACGFCCRGFVTGEWPGMPENIDPEAMEMPTAESMRSARSVAEARAALEKDKQVALAMVAEAGENRLQNEDTTAPWDPNPMKLGQRLLQMVNHLNTHKAQLFYYLKLQGKPVDTWSLYG